MTEQEIRDRLYELAVDKKVFIGAINTNKYYESLGYTKQQIGNRKGYLIKVSDLTKGSHKQIKIVCPECQEERSIVFASIFRWDNFTGLCNSCCGRKKGIATRKDLTGQKFSRLTVLKYAYSKDNRAYWLCKCDCGNEITVRAISLISGNTNSCGCLKKELVTKWHKEQGHWTTSEHTAEENLLYYAEKSKKKNKQWEFNKEFARQKQYLCYLTGKHEWGNIHVHHLNARNLYPEQTYNTNNLVCVRKDLHKQFHFLYGQGGNTVDQFYSYLTLLARR